MFPLRHNPFVLTGLSVVLQASNVLGFVSFQSIHAKPQAHANIFSLNASPNDQHDTNNRKHKDGSRMQLQPRHIYVVPWDGALVSQTPRKIELGLRAAFQVWPELEVMTRDADLQWLYNKLNALQHVLEPPISSNYNYNPAVEYAVAIRMLLDEQELDEGQSNGSQGKYGSKFHPSAADRAFVGFDTTTKNGRRRRRRQQRPLTVGEISANWKDTLREAAWLRYYQEEGENPLDLLHHAILESVEGRNLEVSLIPTFLTIADPQIVEILSELPSSDDVVVVIGVYHASDMEVAKSSLIEAGYSGRPIAECLDVQDIFPQHERGNVPLICLGSGSLTYKDLLRNSPHQSTVHVLESYWSRLQNLIFPLFGDHIPRLRQNLNDDMYRPVMNGLIGKCVEPGRFLQLRLCEWSSHPDAQSAATMSAWTTTLTTQQWAMELEASVSDVANNRPMR